MILNHFKTWVFIICTLSSVILSGQSVNWMTWEEVMAKTQNEPKKILVDIVTEWCGWCKKMDQTTFLDPELVAYLNENYYTIKFDAEHKEPINFKGKTYELENSIWRGGYHQLTSVITKNQLKKLPTIVFLDENAELLQSIPGFKNAMEVELMAAYFHGNYYKSMPWKTFVNHYKASKQKSDSIEFETRIEVHSRIVTQKKN